VQTTSDAFFSLKCRSEAMQEDSSNRSPDMGGEERREKAFLKWGWCVPPGPRPVLILVGMAWSSQGKPLPGTEGHSIAHRWCGPSAYDQRRQIYHLMWLTYLEVESIFITSNKNHKLKSLWFCHKPNKEESKAFYFATPINSTFIHSFLLSVFMIFFLN